MAALLAILVVFLLIPIGLAVVLLDDCATASERER